MGGYDGDVLFENLELIRTVRAAGGTELAAARPLRPPPPADARGIPGPAGPPGLRRLRPAGRLAAFLSVLPAPCCRAALAPPAARGAAGRGAARRSALAEVGRRRAGGAAVFPPTPPLLAPLWLGERAVCGWLAVGRRLRGGVPYAGRGWSPPRTARARCAPGWPGASTGPVSRSPP